MSPTDFATLLARLRNRAKKGHVEVEHLLAFATLGDPAAAPELSRLAEEHQWHARGLIAGSPSRHVPLARWSAQICAYLLGGFDELVHRALSQGERAVDDADGLPPGCVPLGILSAVRSQDSVKAVLRIADASLATAKEDRRLAIGCATALNELLSFSPAVALDAPTAAHARRFLHQLLQVGLVDSDAGIACCALRAVGDAETVALLEQRKPLGSPWQSMPADAIKAIQRRLRKAQKLRDS